MRLLLAMSVLIAASAAGNPFAGIPTYMASEHLSVSIAKSEARFVGDFVFRRAVVVRTEQDSRVVFQIPIWFPEQNPDDKSVAAFWKMFQKDTSHIVPTEKVKWLRPEVAFQMRKTLKRAIALKVVVGKQEIPVTQFSVFAANTKRVGIPQAWKESGYCCVMFNFGVEPSLIRDATRVAISYRQPYLRRDNEARLFYVPIFENLPRDVSTADTNHYAITFTTAEDCSGVIATGTQQLAVKPGQSVTVAPSRYQAIRVTTTTWSNKSPEPSAEGTVSSAARLTPRVGVGSGPGR